ncbi:eukaryotic translation initiation factor 4 gamma 1-like [Trichomycterus rosablanca]|uniref:eukaryotic translation initiation factor 4 gamma 1-like n=1 Tax=Trichomycterus rosablanca TaxID=2290929 RepID=UPI002F3553D9
MIPQRRIYLPYYSEGFDYLRPCGQSCRPFVPQWQQQNPVTCPPAGFTTGRVADYAKAFYPSHVRPSMSSLAVTMNPVHQQLFTAPLIRKERKQIIIKDPTQGGRDITNEIMTGRWTTSQVIIKDPTQGGRDITKDIMSGEWTTPTETSPHSVDAEVQTNSDPVKPAAVAVLRGLLESVEDPAAPTETESSAANENPGSDEAVSKHHDDVQEADELSEKIKPEEDHCDQNKQQQRKKYSRDFLLDLQLNQLSLQRPKVQQHVPDVVLDQPLLQNLYLRDQMREFKPSVTNLDSTVPEPVNVQEEKINEENVSLKSDHCDQNKQQQRKKYSRDFLLDLQLNQLSLQRPKVQQHVPDVVLDQPLLQNLYLRDQMREFKPSVTNLDSTVPEPVNVQEEKINEENVSLKSDHCDQNKQQQRKKYSRDFLLDLQLNQLSLQRPKVQQHVPDVVLDQPLLQNLYLRDQMREFKPSFDNMERLLSEPVEDQEEKMDIENISKHAGSNKLPQRIKYDREFLLNLQMTSASLQRPKVMLDIKNIVLDKPLQQQLFLRDQMVSGKSFSPLIANQDCQKKEGERELPSRMHHLQRDQCREQRKVINVSLNNDVQLHKAEKAWKPAIKKSCTQEKDREATETQELFQKVCSILNKMTPEKFQQLMKQLTELPINTEERLKGVIELIFKKAVAEPNFCTVYAKMCSGLMELKVPTSDYSGSTLDFINLLVGHCEEEFKKDEKDNKLLQKKLKDLDEAEEEKEQQILKEELEEIKIKARLCSLGNIKFMGELYKQKMLTDQFIYRCITKLLENNNEESLESLCKLLSTAGKDLDLDNGKALLDNYFNQLGTIVKERRTSSRIRFMIQDVLDLRRNNWIPRRSDQGPKTIKEVHKDAEVEDNVEQLKVQQKLLLQQSKVQAQNKSWNTKPVYNKKSPNDGSHQGKMPKPCAFNYVDVTSGQKDSLRSRTNSRRSEDVRSHTHFSVKQEKQSGNGDRQCVSNKVKMRKYASQESTESAAVKREPTQAPKATMSKEQLEKKSVAIIEEYLHINDLKEALLCVQEMNSASLLFIFVRIGVETTLERSAIERGHLGLLFHHLIRNQILPAEQYYKGFQEILEVAEDMVVDIPHIWLYLAEIIPPVLQDEGIPMAQLFRELAKPLLTMEQAAMLLVQIINQLSKKMSYKEARGLWDEAGLSWKDFLPEGDDENTFVMEQLPPEWTTM